MFPTIACHRWPSGNVRMLLKLQRNHSNWAPKHRGNLKIRHNRATETNRDIYLRRCRDHSKQIHTLSSCAREHFPGNSRFQCLDKQLGEGSFGVVQLGKDMKTNQYVAIKVIKTGESTLARSRSKAFYDNSFENEFNALQIIAENGGHENLVGLIDVIKVSNGANPANDEVHIVTELVSGGEVFDRLVDNGAFAEIDVARMAYSLASAVDFLHSKCKLAHGDIKPENLMFTSETEDSGIKIIDFGTAMPLRNDEEIESAEKPGFARGTTAYWSPENFLGPEKYKYGAPSDMFSIGLVLYICLYGAHPFDPNNDLTDEEVAQRIIDNNWSFLDDRVPNVTPAAKKLVSALLEPEISKRYTAKQMLNNPWVQGTTASKVTIQGSHTRLDKFQRARRKLKNGLLTVLIQQAIQSTREEEESCTREMKLSRNTTASLVVKRAFDFFDSDGKGYITPDDVSTTLADLDVKLDRVEAGDLITNASHASNRNKPKNRASNDILEYEDVANFLAEIPRKHCKAGSFVFREGDESEHFYLVLKGVVDVFVESKETGGLIPVDTIGPGHFFGEQGVIANTKRSATIGCASDVDLLVLDKRDFDSLRNEAVFKGKTESSLEELILERTLGRLNTLVAASKYCKRQKTKSQAVVFEKGDSGDYVYVIIKGDVSVVDTESPNEKILVQLHEGDMFGETSLMTGKPRNATAICSSESGCEFNKLNKANFLRIVSEIEQAKEHIKARNVDSFQRSATKEKR